MKKKPKFVILSPSQNELSGGMTVLYFLKKKLEDFGYEVKMQHFRSPKKIDTDIDETVVIYPEIIEGNPTGAKHVVRWILNNVGVIGGNASTHKETDLIYKFNDYFKYYKPINGVMSLIDFKWDIFKNNNIERDIEHAHLIGKAHSYYSKFEEHPRPSMGLDYNLNSIQKAANTFNKIKYFYTYDLVTFWSVAAAMCGAISVVIPKKDKKSVYYMSKEEYFEKLPLRRYCVAYGEDDIERMLSERDKLIPYLKSLEKENDESVKKMIQDCIEKINKE